MSLIKFKKDLQSGHGCGKNGHFKCYLDNIYQGKMSSHFQAMFLNASGNELKEKATAIHSSSMLAYNFFHWISPYRPFVYEGVRYTEVYFEIKLWTLTCSKQAPANMDVVLLGKKGSELHILFLESKFTEFFENSDFNLKPSYYNENNYFKSHAKSMLNIFVKGFMSFDIDGYGEGIKQGVTHIFGLVNLHNEVAFSYFKEQLLSYNFNSIIGKYNSLNDLNIHFANIIFNPIEDNKNEEYRGLYKDTVIKAFEDSRLKGNSNLEEIKILSYRDLWDEMKKQDKIDSGLLEFLWQRYMRFAEGAER